MMMMMITVHRYISPLFYLFYAYSEYIHSLLNDLLLYFVLLLEMGVALLDPRPVKDSNMAQINSNFNISGAALLS
jgi:hypothetical protein